MTKKPIESHLPARRNAPKRTGKGGVGGVKPLDQAADFEKGVKKEGTGTEEVQAELLKMPEEKKPVVVKNRIKVSYLKPIFSKAPKSGDKLISLAISFYLTEEHKSQKLLPKSIRDGWNFISKRGRKKLDLIDVPRQIVKFFLDQKDDSEQLVMPAAKVTNCSLAVIQKKGEGEALKMIRLSFRFQVAFSHMVAKFAESNYGNEWWITMANTDETLFDEEEDESGS